MFFVRDIKKEHFIIAFYVLYFSWLFTVTYLTQEVGILNPFSLFIAAFYFLFLKEEGDLGWFSLGIFISLTLTLYRSYMDVHGFYIDYTSYWLHITWATTILALRKLILILEN